MSWKWDIIGIGALGIGAYLVISNSKAIGSWIGSTVGGAASELSSGLLGGLGAANAQTAAIQAAAAATAAGTQQTLAGTSITINPSGNSNLGNANIDWAALNSFLAHGGTTTVSNNPTPSPSPTPTPSPSSNLFNPNGTFNQSAMAPAGSTGSLPSIFAGVVTTPTPTPAPVASNPAVSRQPGETYAQYQHRIYGT